MKARLLTISVLLLGFSESTNAQFWKKLKSKVVNKVENKLNKEADKAIDNVLNGKPKKQSNTFKNKDYGDFSISHSIKFDTKNIDRLSKPRMVKEGDKISIHGSWETVAVDVADGYYLVLKKGVSIENINKKKRFSIPNEATLKLNYAITKDNKIEGGARNYQDYELKDGYVDLQIEEGKRISFSFSGNAQVIMSSTYNKETEEMSYNRQLMSVSGKGFAKEPNYDIIRVTDTMSKKDEEVSDTKVLEVFKKVLPTVDIPSTFTFNKTLSIEITDDRGDTHPINYLLGNYPDIYAISIDPSQTDGGQGNVYMVMTPKSTTAFMDMGVMKIRKSTSIEQLGNVNNIENRLPEDGDFTYKATGKTKSILGYTCQEYKVDYNYTNEKGSASFWVSNDFPIQNKELPMLGMKMNNTNFSGFVLEINSNYQGNNWTMKVVKIQDKSVKINTNEYRKM